MACLFFCMYIFYLCLSGSWCWTLHKSVSIGGGGSGGAAPGSHSSFADDKAPADLESQMQAMIYLRSKSSAQHDFIDHCILSRANGIQREIKVKG